MSAGGFVVTSRSVMVWVLVISLEEPMGHFMTELNQRGIRHNQDVTSLY